MTTPPMCTLIVAARWFPRSPVSLRWLTRNCAMFTFPSPAWRICFCTTPEGACANELEDFSGPAGPRCACGSAQSDSVADADLFAADDVRFHLRPRHGEQRLHAGRVQKSPLARNHGYQHGFHRSMGRGHAVDWRISVHSGDRRSPAGADTDFMAGH